jgi:hypothetical protein
MYMETTLSPLQKTKKWKMEAGIMVETENGKSIKGLRQDLTNSCENG